uniref:Uncharacterized protein n=1 Tax=Meloidogyne enterolobii TaxID=390850 RepID=A0A6V7VJH8_MELEN|nr:unnamed protein product [Meloidogyne enterolobii]
MFCLICIEYAIGTEVVGMFSKVKQHGDKGKGSDLEIPLPAGMVSKGKQTVNIGSGIHMSKWKKHDGLAEILKLAGHNFGDKEAKSFGNGSQHNGESANTETNSEPFAELSPDDVQKYRIEINKLKRVDGGFVLALEHYEYTNSLGKKETLEKGSVYKIEKVLEAVRMKNVPGLENVTCKLFN